MMNGYPWQEVGIVCLSLICTVLMLCLAIIIGGMVSGNEAYRIHPSEDGDAKEDEEEDEEDFFNS